MRSPAACAHRSAHPRIGQVRARPQADRRVEPGLAPDCASTCAVRRKRAVRLQLTSVGIGGDRLMIKTRLPSQYSPVQKWFHWLMALLILSMLVIGVTMKNLNDGGIEGLALRVP